ncbi:unnamed protein product [Cochlearia groenlandica]
MRKSNRSKTSATNIGNGEITQTQIAFIVDRYLYENRFYETRNIFRSEASSLLSNSPIREVLKSYLTLDEILKHYVCLKKQKVALEQEKSILDQEKSRVQNLLQGMQNVMNTYNNSLAAPPPPPPATVVAEAPPVSRQKGYNSIVSSSGFENTPNAMSVSLLGNKRVDFGNFSTPFNSQAHTITRKRRGPENSVGATPVAKKPRASSMTRVNSTSNETNQISLANSVSSQTQSETLTLAKESSAREMTMTSHGSSVAKCLFNKADSSTLPSSSTCLITPQKHASHGNDKSNSAEKEPTPPTNCTIVTKERFTISPLKQITSYSVERSHLISSSSPVKPNLRRDHVRGKLNFDDTDTERFLEPPVTADLASTSSPSGVSEPEVDLSDIDFSILGENFSFSELLFDIGCEGSTPYTPTETNPGSSPDTGNENL